MQSWSLISVDYHLYYCHYSLIQVRLRQVKFFFSFSVTLTKRRVFRMKGECLSDY